MFLANHFAPSTSFFGKHLAVLFLMGNFSEAVIFTRSFTHTKFGLIVKLLLKYLCISFEFRL